MIKLISIVKQILMEGGNVFGTTTSIEKANIANKTNQFWLKDREVTIAP
jgi:hypothetical protein